MRDLREHATDKNKFDNMVKLLSECSDTKKEMEELSMMYIGDMSYPREDICLALKAVGKEKGWI